MDETRYTDSEGRFLSRAKIRAERRRCPSCDRKSALEGPIDMLTGTAYRCRYCGHVRERRDGEMIERPPNFED